MSEIDEVLKRTRDIYAVSSVIVGVVVLFAIRKWGLRVAWKELGQLMLIGLLAFAGLVLITLM